MKSQKRNKNNRKYKKKDFEKINNIMIYPIDYLIHAELSEADLHRLLDTPSLAYSLHLYMLSLCKNYADKTHKEWVDFAKESPTWMYEAIWTQQARNTAEKNITQAVMNIYNVNEEQAERDAIWYMFMYGPTVENNTFIQDNQASIENAE